MADAHRLVAARGVPRSLDDLPHPLRYLLVWLPPGRGERVPQVPPVERVECQVREADGLALQHVLRLDQAPVSLDGQALALRRRLRRLLRSLQRGGEQGRNVTVGEEVGGGVRHEPPVVREVKVRQSPVKDVPWVVDLTMPQQVDSGFLSHSAARLPCPHQAICRYRRRSAITDLSLARCSPTTTSSTAARSPARPRASARA